MKKLVLIAIALVSLQAIAQDHKGMLQKGEQKVRSQMIKDFNPEQIALLQTKKMTLHLDLTKAQQEEIQKINLANATERKAKMEARRKMRENGNMLSKEDRFNIMNERLDKRIAHKKQMQNILTKEQFEKLEKDVKNKHMKQCAKKQRSKWS
jgi:periplasmic protein CpxP/Spy